MCILCDRLGSKSTLSQAISQSNNPKNNSKNPKPGSSGVGDSLYPNFGNGGYDTKHYTLDLNVTDVKTSNLDATATIEATAKQNLNRFNLDFIGFAIEGITVNGEPAKFSRDGQELIITPAKPLHKGNNFTVEVDYNGVPEQIDSAAFTFPVPTGWVIVEDGNFVLSEPDGAANYYPVNDHPIDRASYTFRVTTPKPYEVAANGVLEETIDNGDTTTYIFEARDPMVSYLTTVNIDKNFNIEMETGVDGIPIRNYFAEGIPEEKLAPFDRQPEMLALFQEFFGPYPFELYGSVVVNTDTGAALETQTLSIFGTDTLESDTIEETVAHELAHQWFGNSLALSDWSDIWLNESFATYSQGLWIEGSQGGDEALNEWVKKQYDYIAENFDTLVVPGEPLANDLFNPAVYEWGALGLHALRLEIGDEDFFESLQTYARRFQESNVVPEDFIAIVEEVSAQQLDSLFDRWFYSEELASIPELNLFAGTLDDDALFGTDADETFSGLDGNDTIFGNGGANVLIGNSGDDLLFGGGSGDALGQGFRQRILGGDGDDKIFAVGKDSFVDSGEGLDTVWLGAEASTVVLNSGSDYDKIKNFQLGETKLQVESLDNLSFANSDRGTRISQADDLLAVVSWQTADTFSSNINEIFVV
jgi:hypothetical protein